MLPTNLTDLDGDGEWAPLIDWSLIAIHSMVLPDGRVISYGTNENGMQGGVFVYALFDPETNISVTMEKTTPTDIFCSNMGLDTYLGHTLIIGGDEEPLGYQAWGVNDVNVFDHATDTIVPAATGDMSGARWYPSILTLGNGDILALGGRDSHIRNGEGNTTVELYRSGIGWDTLDDICLDISDRGKWWYPTTWQRSDGKVIMFEGTSNSGGADYYLFDLEGEGTITHLGVAPMLFGVQLPSIQHRIDQGLMMDNRGQIWLVDFSSDTVTFEVIADLGQQRQDSDFTLLADGRVALTGGADRRNSLETADTSLLIWDPETGVLTTHENEDLARLYHSSVQLLPDGTLITMGGGAPGPLVNTNAQIWAPDYLFVEDGSQAVRAQDSVADIPLQAGERFLMTVENAQDVTTITAVRSGASTHSKNADARFLELEHTVLDGNTIEVALPDNPNVVPPGTWMTFAFNDQGVPSDGSILNIVPGTVLRPDVPGHYAFGTSTYMLGTAGLTWDEAASEAEALGGRLVQIETQAENDFIRDTFFRDNPVWLGLTDTETEGLFQNLDGDTPAFLNWTDITAYNRNVAHSYGIMTAPDGTWRMSRIGPSPASFDAEGRPAQADAISVIEFENTRDIILQTGNIRLRHVEGEEWFSVTYNTVMDDPIVIISPPSFNGGSPITTRVRNVTQTGFDVQIDEWDYLDGRHAFEDISWMAVERGVHVLSDGSTIEAGSSMVGSEFTDIALNAQFGPFGPVVLGQVTSATDASAVNERITNVDRNGFSVRLQEEEASVGDHLPEQFDYVAFELGNHTDFSAFSRDRLNHAGTTIDLNLAANGDVLFADLQSYNGQDPVVLRLRSQDETTATLALQEERSRNEETDHAYEDVGWVTVNDTIYSTGRDVADPPPQLIAQTGTLSLGNSDGEDWVMVQFSVAMTDPVVVVSPATAGDSDPVTLRTRKVTENGFEVQLDEWEYLDGIHGNETISWMAVERGVHVTPDGSLIEAGNASASSGRATVALRGPYESAPVVLGQVASFNDTRAVQERFEGITNDSFSFRLRHEQADGTAHATESFDWVALETGRNGSFSAFNTDQINHQGGELDLTRADQTHAFFADIQSLHGRDNTGLRIMDRTDSSLRISLEEETSFDAETRHADEIIGWAMLDQFIFV